MTSVSAIADTESKCYKVINIVFNSKFLIVVELESYSSWDKSLVISKLSKDGNEKFNHNVDIAKNAVLNQRGICIDDNNLFSLAPERHFYR